MEPGFSERLERAGDLADIYELVKEAARVSIGRERGGLMLALADLGNHPRGFLGAFYPLDSNAIVMNRVPLARIQATRPELYKPYVFMVLLHEYLHALRFHDEEQTRIQTYRICRAVLGEESPATRMALDPLRYFPNLVFPDAAWSPDITRFEIVPGFDRSSASYIR
ncbi:MAG: hypothetical protein QXO51_06225 [Halobacteria archaeon]